VVAFFIAQATGIIGDAHLDKALLDTEAAPEKRSSTHACHARIHRVGQVTAHRAIFTITLVGRSVAPPLARSLPDHGTKPRRSVHINVVTPSGLRSPIR
jgi:hypothetical protein